MASQTATERGEVELGIFDFKTTWSEFQKPGQTAAVGGKAELRILDLKPPGRSFRSPVRAEPESVQSSCVRLITKATNKTLNKILFFKFNSF